MIRTLSCHCGAIRLETNARLGAVIDCNCTTCAEKSTAGGTAFRPLDLCLALRRRGPAFLPTCGTAMCKTGPDGYLVLNANCIDGIDPHTLKVERYDGLTDVPGGDVPPLHEHG
jgi:hypothetical protein